MNRRTFVMGLGAAGAIAAPARYEPNWESLKQHPVPDWFDDAKLGIFIHWGLYSVPAWAPPTGELGKVDWNKWFYQNPYAEWYLNSIRLKASDTYKHHTEKYGADYDYYRFAGPFLEGIKKWSPEPWAKLFRDTGAKYVVLTTKHHDGFTLWPSRVKHPKRQDINCQRDLVGALTSAVRKQGMEMGLYYSGGLDWTFEETPIAGPGDLRKTVPQSAEYAAYADAHWRELIDRYETAILWNDINYPKLGKLPEIFADYYNRFPNGLVSNRFGVEHADFTTPEYTKYDKIVEKKWESCRGLGFSFGYNQVEDDRHVIAADKLIELLVDIVAKNGNLLLNVGPKPDGSISEIQMDRLRALGAWMKLNGEAIHGSRPWTSASAKTSTGEEVCFTRKGDKLYAIIFAPRAGETLIPGVKPRTASVVDLLGSGRVEATSTDGGLRVKLAKASPTPLVLRMAIG
jgi:alpha-L-fucosidase